MNIQVQQPLISEDVGHRVVIPSRRPGFVVRWPIRPSVLLPSIVLLVLALWAIEPAWFAPYRPTAMDQNAILQAPSLAHLLGSDHLGRDILSLVIYGSGQSLMVGIGAVSISLLIGGPIGAITGYAGGVLDMAVMRLIDIWLSVPSLLLILLIATALPPNLGNIILIIGLVTAPHFARVMRSQVLAVKSRPFVEASRAIGGSHLSIFLRHILPHTLSQMLVLCTLGVGTAMLTGAMLSFIGVGAIQDRPDWGFLLNQGRSYLTVAWWFATFPGLAITAVVISLNLLGDALRQRLDPRSRIG